jgi:hypothetical protein
LVEGVSVSLQQTKGPFGRASAVAKTAAAVAVLMKRLFLAATCLIRKVFGKTASHGCVARMKGGNVCNALIFFRFQFF